MEEAQNYKPPNIESQSEEAKKRPEVVRDLFNEDDSDDETEVYPRRYDDAPYHAFEKERRCLDSHLCHRYQHHTDFEGLPFFEIFKVKVKFNKNYATTPITGTLYGKIVTVPDPNYHREENPFPISYYSASCNKPDSISLDHGDNNFALLPISGPTTRPAICDGYTLALDFAFKINYNDVFSSYGFRRENPQLFGDDGGCAVEPLYVRGLYDRGSRKDGHYILRRAIGLASFDNMIGINSCDHVTMVTYFSVYEGAWATIDVKMMRDDVRGLYGLIVARSCVFSRRFRLLTIQQGSKKVTIERGGDGEVDEKTRSIKLTRSVVTVPSYSSLIIGAALYGPDNKPICHGKVSFPARESGKETCIIFHNGIKTLEITVRWNCQV